jgi:hypothetical protein
MNTLTFYALSILFGPIVVCPPEGVFGNALEPLPAACECILRWRLAPRGGHSRLFIDTRCVLDIKEAEFSIIRTEIMVFHCVSGINFRVTIQAIFMVLKFVGIGYLKIKISSGVNCKKKMRTAVDVSLPRSRSREL